MKILWTEEEDRYLSANYFDSNPEELCEQLSHRSWDAIKLHAAKLGIHRAPKSQFINNTRILLEDSLQSAYWLGVLFADGHFSTRGRIALTLKCEDKQHVRKFADYVGGTVRNERTKRGDCYSSKVMCVNTARALRSRFNISSNKTSNPISFNYFMDSDLFTAMIIGFIDGDGCIGKQSKRKDCLIRIKLHKSWLGNLILMTEWLASKVGFSLAKPHINKQGYAEAAWAHRSILRYLKTFGIENHLPVLQRKWNIICDVQPLSKTEQAKVNMENILNMTQNGLTSRQIAKLLLLSESCVSVIKKKHGIRKT